MTLIWFLSVTAIKHSCFNTHKMYHPHFKCTACVFKSRTGYLTNFHWISNQYYLALYIACYKWLKIFDSYLIVIQILVKSTWTFFGVCCWLPQSWIPTNLQFTYTSWWLRKLCLGVLIFPKLRLLLHEHLYCDTRIKTFLIPCINDSKLLCAWLFNPSSTIYIVINSFILCSLSTKKSFWHADFLSQYDLAPYGEYAWGMKRSIT